MLKNIQNLIRKTPKRTILKTPKFIMDANFQDFAVLPHSSQEIEGPIKVVTDIQHQSL